MQVIPIQTRIYQENENIVDFIIEHIPSLAEETVLVITSKIVALGEGRVHTIKSKEEKIALIKAESDQAVETKWVWLTVKDGQVYAAAGIDESNVGDQVCVLLPEDSYAAAAAIRTRLMEHYGLKTLGVLITDSRTVPLRSGTTGISLGYAGFEGLRDYRGLPDIYDRPFKVSQTNVADGLAAAAVFIMGEGSERQPLATVTDARVVFTDRVIKKEEIQIPLEDDLYLPFFKEFEF